MEYKYFSSSITHKQRPNANEGFWDKEVETFEEKDNIPTDIDKIDRENDRLFRKMVDLMPEGPQSPAVQKLIKKHYRSLKNIYEPTLSLYRGLANLYVEDGRFIDYFQKYHPDLPQFMHDAMIVFCVSND